VTELRLIFRPSDLRIAEVEFHLSHKHLSYLRPAVTGSHTILLARAS
jgi:hypothetical protein